MKTTHGEKRKYYEGDEEPETKTIDSDKRIQVLKKKSYIKEELELDLSRYKKTEVRKRVVAHVSELFE